MHTPSLYTVLATDAAYLGALVSDFNAGDIAFVQSTGLYYQYVDLPAPGPAGTIASAAGGYFEPWAVAPAGSAIYGSFSDSATQNFVAGSAFAVQYDTNEGAVGVSIENNALGFPTRMKVAASGIYAFTVSPQLVHSGGGDETVTFWARLSETNVPRSSSKVMLGNNNTTVLPFLELILSMTAGQYVEWIFYADPGTSIALQASPAVVGPPAIPAIPSVIAGVKRLGS